MARRRSPWLRSFLAATALAHLIFAGIVALRSAGALEALELLAYDAYLARSLPAGQPETEVVVVAITDDDVDGDTTVDDGVLAETLERLSAAEPAAIGLDLLRYKPVPPGADALATVLRQHPEIVVISGYGDAQQEGRAPPPAVTDPARIGFADMDLDPDGILRRGLLYLAGGDGPGVALGLRLAERYLAAHGVLPQSDHGHLRLGAATYVPLGAADGGYATLPGGGYQFLLSFPGCRSGLPMLSITDVLDGDGLDGLEGRVVVLGNRVRDAKDVFKVPVACAGGIERQIYGVDVHAQIVAQLIHEAEGDIRQLRTPEQVLRDPIRGRIVGGGWIWLWTVGGGLAAWRVRRALPLAGIAVCGLAALVGTTLLAFSILGWWVPVVPPALGGLLALGTVIGFVLARERFKQARLQRLFSAYVSPGIAPTLWRDEDDPDESAPAPRELTATVLFSDIRGFTTISERMPEGELMAWLNEYMAVMADLVIAQGGVIEKFAGDGLTAEFGVPEPRTSAAGIAADARAAVDCGLAMGEALVHLNRDWRARGLPEIGIRIGIHTGPVVVGNLGSAARMQYSVIGDTANTAARIESYGKDEPSLNREADHCRILISEASLAHLGRSYPVELVGTLTLRGKARSITVYRVLGGPDASKAKEVLP